MKLALVTGGCHRLGAAIAARLADEGYALALHASEEPVPDSDLAEALQRNETRWHGFAADLADAGQSESLIGAIGSHFGSSPSLLVNNAAMFGDDRPENATFEGLLTHYAVNCVAPAILSRCFSDAEGDGDRSIVNILDQRLAAPHGDQFSYTLSKIALGGLTRILAKELAPGVRVNGVAPGLTIPTADYDEERTARIAEAMPLSRLPRPGDVADAVAWLARSASVTGQTLFVDAGAHMESFARDFVHLDL